MPIKTYHSEKALDAQVLFLLYQHKGKDNAINRWQLVRSVFGDEAVPASADQSDGNLYDRQVRERIERWRPQGHFICNRGDGKGYYIATSRPEYEEWKKYYLGPSYTKFTTTSRLDELADEKWGKVPKVADPLPLFDGLQAP